MQTPTEQAQTNGVPQESHAARNLALGRALFWVGIAGASAAIAFLVIRSAMKRPPADPTTQRIEALIDEANRLLKALEEQK